MSSSAGSTEAIIWKDYVEEGLPPPDYFQVQPVDLPQEIQDGQALVELLYITVDPYLRGRMKNVPGYFSAAFQPGKPMSGLRGVATVKQSKASQLKEGLTHGLASHDMTGGVLDYVCLESQSWESAKLQLGINREEAIRACPVTANVTREKWTKR